MELSELKLVVNKSIKKLMQNDFHLIKVRSSERSVCHHLAVYMAEQVKSLGFFVDCEYNRNGTYPKSLVAVDGNVYPDIIIHKRGSNRNSLVMEVKYANEDNKRDLLKMKGYIEELEYKYGLLLTVSHDPKESFVQEWWGRNVDGQASKVISSAHVDLVHKSVKSIFKLTNRINKKKNEFPERKNTKRLIKKLKKN